MSLKIRDILAAIRSAAPEEWAFDWDHVGLQVGDPGGEVDTILLTLDVTAQTLDRAGSEQAGLIVSHHPLIFAPLSRIDPSKSPGKEVARLIENRIALFVAHTNLDASPVLSMNAGIGRRLPLRDFGPAASPPRPSALKLVTFVPVENLEEVRASLAAAGAGTIGDYTECAFSTSGVGSFCGGEASHPAVGEKGRLEKVDEERLEILCPEKNLDAVLKALWETHPYEEVAYDLYPLSGYRSDAHLFWIGELGEGTRLSDLAEMVDREIGNSEGLTRFAGDPSQVVRKLGWCSGGGKSLIPLAADSGVDAYLTGDTGHHDALGALSRQLALIDVPHYHTEILFVDILREFLLSAFGEESVQIISDRSEPVFHSVGRGFL